MLLFDMDGRSAKSITETQQDLGFNSRVCSSLDIVHSPMQDYVYFFYHC